MNLTLNTAAMPAVVLHAPATRFNAVLADVGTQAFWDARPPVDAFAPTDTLHLFTPSEMANTHALFADANVPHEKAATLHTYGLELLTQALHPRSQNQQTTPPYIKAAQAFFLSAAVFEWLNAPLPQADSLMQLAVALQYLGHSVQTALSAEEAVFSLPEETSEQKKRAYSKAAYGFWLLSTMVDDVKSLTQSVHHAFFHSLCYPDDQLFGRILDFDDKLTRMSPYDRAAIPAYTLTVQMLLAGSTLLLQQNQTDKTLELFGMLQARLSFVGIIAAVQRKGMEGECQKRSLWSLSGDIAEIARDLRLAKQA
ncbi:MAG: hypothetical protein COX62_08925 [Deltaproteobacteria bacterium CG_4_10_14_0_2_um_filter_43_8]|nr:MAG: hypothetical protein COV43_07295 [Deltaproteobacteria bacterium CG11_big_fil_rev_8_21_14_0_20_42_23]PJA18262.1 MAG: hypothetical protein COX62_08925 [Deltaproteobacteria bacterium CG_4_10_14_0_2_um_filter_43_8]PJC64908.1 MAG: hypothetical protein CO021_01855 [Deltaproteobacteria bacterium CG_4_9_14_0_2_um_filter_42_21]